MKIRAFFSLLFIVNKIFKWPNPIFAFLWISIICKILKFNKHMQICFSPLWPQSTPGDHDLYDLEFAVICEFFKVSFSFSGFVVCEKRILKWLYPFVHFCDYLPFEEDMAFDLYNFKIRLYLKMIWTKFDWNWAAGSWEDIFVSFLNGSPTVAPLNLQSPWFV
jgi:hypothetical protein